MWAAQYYSHKRARQWLTSAGLGAMGFGLPAAAGAAVGNPGITVVDIDGDGSFQMNAQELSMIQIENLPVKVMVLNNQHLGMVVQWEDRFYHSNRAHTYLGTPANEGEVYPDFIKISEGYNRTTYLLLVSPIRVKSGRVSRGCCHAGDTWALLVRCDCAT